MTCSECGRRMMCFHTVAASDRIRYRIYKCACQHRMETVEFPLSALGQGIDGEIQSKVDIAKKARKRFLAIRQSRGPSSG